MNKRRYYKALLALIAAGALLAAGALTATGCKQPEQGGGQGSGSGSGSGSGQGSGSGSGQGSGQGSGSGAVISGEIEFSDTLRKNNGEHFGVLTVWISEGKATVRFKNASAVEFGGNGDVGTNGTVKFELHEVNHPEAAIPFEGRYDGKARTFTLLRLTKDYPENIQMVLYPVKGNVPYTRKTFVRYMEKLHDNLTAAVLITVDGDRVYLTIWYGQQGVRKHCISKTTVIQGNTAEVDVDFDGTVYCLSMEFTEDSDNATDDARTNWYLGRKNDAAKLPTDPKYVGGFKYYLKEGKNEYKGKVIPQHYVTTASVDVYNAREPLTTNKLGTLNIKIAGSRAYLEFTTTDVEFAVADGEKNTRKMRIVVLDQMGSSNLYRSRPMTHASVQVMPAVATNNGKVYNLVNPTADSVFTFYDAHSGTYDTWTHFTYDFMISDYDPVAKTFRLEGRYLTKTTLCAAAGTTRAAGAQLIAGGTGTQLYWKPTGSITSALSGNYLIR